MATDDKLAAAERRFRALTTRYPMGGVDHARVLMAEYDRRGEAIEIRDRALARMSEQLRLTNFDVMNAEAALHARNVDAKSATIQAVGLRADLARALPVVEAAGALVEHFGPYSIAEMSPLGQRKFKALARAYRAAREPRTGEGS